MEYLVFVYGTLRSGKHNHGWLRDAPFEGDDSLMGNLQIKDGWLPTLLEAGPQAEVPGEVYRVTEDILAGLDVLEGVAKGLYESRPVTLKSGREALVYYYVYGR